MNCAAALPTARSRLSSDRGDMLLLPHRPKLSPIGTDAEQGKEHKREEQAHHISK